MRKIGKRKVKMTHKKSKGEKKKTDKSSLLLQEERETRPQENKAKNVKREEGERQVSSQDYSCHKEKGQSNNGFFHQPIEVTFSFLFKEVPTTEITVSSAFIDVFFVRLV